MIEQIERLYQLVMDYELGNDNPHKLVVLQKQITTTLFYLETERAKVHDKYKRLVFDLTRKNGNEKPMSVAQATTEADVKHPEMYQLRRIMDAGYKVADAIRTHISFLKSERHHSQTQS